MGKKKHKPKPTITEATPKELADELLRRFPDGIIALRTAVDTNNIALKGNVHHLIGLQERVHYRLHRLLKEEEDNAENGWPTPERGAAAGG